MLSKFQTDTQEVLDDLTNEKLMPFKLVARRVTEENRSEVRIHFYDSRLHSIVVAVRNKTSIKEQMREAILLGLKGSGFLAMPLRVSQTHV